MNIKKMIAIAIGLLASTLSNAALVQVNITGSVEYYESFNLFGVNESTVVSGHIIYDESVALASNTNDTHYITDYNGWEFSLTIGEFTFNEEDSPVRPGTHGAALWFDEGPIEWFTLNSVEGIEPSISRSEIRALDDTDYGHGFEMFHEWGTVGAQWLVADGSLVLSEPVPISAVPLPSSLILFISGIAFLLRVRSKR